MTLRMSLKLTRSSDLNHVHLASRSCQQRHNAKLITSRVSGQGNRIGPVCVCVCPFVNALTAERLDVRTQKLVSGCSWSMP